MPPPSVGKMLESEGAGLWGWVPISPESRAITLIDITLGPTSNPQLVKSRLIFPSGKLLLATAQKLTLQFIVGQSGLVRKVVQKCFVLEVNIRKYKLNKRYCI